MPAEPARSGEDCGHRERRFQPISVRGRDPRVESADVHHECDQRGRHAGPFRGRHPRDEFPRGPRE